jgi:hypothetical protein
MAAYPLATVVFRTKATAIAAIQTILHHASHYVPLKGHEADLIASLYRRHPECDGYPDPVYFTVGKNVHQGVPSNGFRAMFADGTFWAFSYRECFTPTRPGLTRVLAAMRHATMDGQFRLKVATFNGGATVLCGLRLVPACLGQTAFADAHVHHQAPKFRAIADDYMATHGVPEITPHAIADHMADAAVKAAWVAFHDARARRVVICRVCNAAAERRGAAS